MLRQCVSQALFRPTIQNGNRTLRTSACYVARWVTATALARRQNAPTAASRTTCGSSVVPSRGTSTSVRVFRVARKAILPTRVRRSRMVVDGGNARAVTARDRASDGAGGWWGWNTYPLAGLLQMDWIRRRASARFLSLVWHWMLRRLRKLWPLE
jgi:hypothetical protein